MRTRLLLQAPPVRTLTIDLLVNSEDSSSMLAKFNCLETPAPSAPRARAPSQMQMVPAGLRIRRHRGNPWKVLAIEEVALHFKRHDMFTVHNIQIRGEFDQG